MAEWILLDSVKTSVALVTAPSASTTAQYVPVVQHHLPPPHPLRHLVQMENAARAVKVREEAAVGQLI